MTSNASAFLEVLVEEVEVVEVMWVAEGVCMADLVTAMDIIVDLLVMKTAPDGTEIGTEVGTEIGTEIGTETEIMPVGNKCELI